MKVLIRELDENFVEFCNNWKTGLTTTSQELSKYSDKFRESYYRVASLQAWRSDVLEPYIDSKSLEFFLEAQNDALVSHVLAQIGSWRQALQALRSCIENVLFCLFYMDHPIELVLWHQGTHKINFQDLRDYISRHPKSQGLPKSVIGLELLKNEYATLSRAVHASAKSFRMTQDATATQLWIPAEAKLNAWITREKTTITAINLLLLAIFRERLQGAALPGVRKAISLSIPKAKHADIKKYLKVNLLSK